MVSVTKTRRSLPPKKNPEATSGGNALAGETSFPGPPGTRERPDQPLPNPGNPNNPSHPEEKHQRQRHHLEYQASTI